jgi:hypothetical protein
MTGKQQGIDRTQHGEEQPGDRDRAQTAQKSNPENDTDHPTIDQKPKGPHERK